MLYLEIYGCTEEIEYQPQLDKFWLKAGVTDGIMSGTIFLIFDSKTGIRLNTILTEAIEKTRLVGEGEAVEIAGDYLRSIK